MKRSRRVKSNTVTDNLVHAVASLQVEMRKSTDQVENAILMMNARASADALTDKSKEVAALVGLWIDRQKASGQTTVDLKRVDDIRTGIELALS